MKKIIKCLMIIIGTLVGAGFASGQEIALFFNRFYESGVCGIIFASLLFGLVIFFMILISKNNITYIDMIKNNKLVIFIMRIFTMVCFCIMISAIGTFVKEEFSIPYFLGVGIASIICFIFFLFKFKSLERINVFLVPAILIGIIIVCTNSELKNVEYDCFITDYLHFLSKPNLLFNWFQSAFLYVGYNSILLMPILVELNVYCLSKSDVNALAILTALFLCITGLLIYYTINQVCIYGLDIEMPMLFIAKQIGGAVFVFYSIVVLFAIFTTAFSSGYAFLKLSDEKKYIKNCILICSLSFLLSGIGFSNLISLCFPAFGYLGILQVIYIIFFGLKNIVLKDKKLCTKSNR